MPNWMPKPQEILREAIIVAAGALVATLIVRQLPDNVRGLFSFTSAASQTDQL